MRNRVSVALTALAAIVVMAAAVGTASAGRFAGSTENIRAVFRPLTFNGPFSQNIICDVTLEGSFHSRTITKTLGALIGFITRAIVNENGCTGAADFASVLEESLPWHISYEGFTGTLPNITGIRLLLDSPAFLLSGTSVGECLYEGNARGIAVPGATSTTLQAEGGTSIPLVEGGFFCPSTGTFSGSAPVTVLGSSTAVTIRLI